MTKFAFNRFGIVHDPRGAQVTWTVAGRTYLADVVDFWRDPVTGCTMLKTRHFNGEPAPAVAATFVDVLERRA